MFVNTNDLHRSSSLDAATMRHVEVATMQHVDAGEGGNGAKEMRQDSLELAAAIRELEESTAALQSAYDAPSHTSLHGSSGYGTMNGTPSGSEDTFDAGDCELPSSKVNQSHKCSTIPGSGVPNHHAAVKHETQSNSPVSSTGLPDALDAATENLADGVVSPDGRFSNHRSIISIKPPLPVHRTASIIGSPASHCLNAHPLQRKMSEVGFYPGRQVPSSGCQYHGMDPAVCRNPAKLHGRQAPLLNPKLGCFDQVRRDGHLSLSVGISANGTSSTSPLPLADGEHYAEPSVVSVTSRWPYAMEPDQAAKSAFPAPHYQNMAPVSSTTYVGGRPTGSGVEKDARHMPPPPPPTGVTGVCLAGKMAVMDPAFFPESHHLPARTLRCEQLPSSVHAPASMDCAEDDFLLPPSAEELRTLYCGSSGVVTDSPKQEQLMMDLKSHILDNCPKM